MKTVVIGSGVAGLECVKNLTGEVVWISKEDYMIKKWLMSAMVVDYTEEKKDKILVNIPEYIEKNHMNVKFVIDEVKGIDTKKKEVIGTKERYKYDKLVIATGATPKIPPLNIEDNEMVTTFETCRDFLVANEKLKKARRVSIVGAGPIGFEMSMRIASKYKISLIEHDKDVLMFLLKKYHLYRFIARQMLKLRGVKLYLATNACGIKDGALICKTIQGEDFTIDSDLVVFAIGVTQNVPPIDRQKFGKDRVLFCNDFAEAFIQEPDGTTKKLEDVYAIGDATHYLNAENYPASAIFAEKTAKVAAFNILNGNKKKINHNPSIYYKLVNTILRRIFT